MADANEADEGSARMCGVSPREAGTSCEQVEEGSDAGNVPQQSGNSQVKGTGANAFMGLLGSGSSDSGIEEDVPAKNSKGLNAFAGLAGSEEDEDEEEAKSGTPKASRARSKAFNAFAGLMGSGSDASEEDEEAEEPAQASRSSAKKSKAANVFSGLMDSDDTEVSDEEQPMEEVPAASEAKAVGAFAGLMGESSTDEDTESGQLDSGPVVKAVQSSVAGASGTFVHDGHLVSDDDDEVAEVNTQQGSGAIGTTAGDTGVPHC